MCRKTPAVSYFYKKVQITRKSELLQQLEDTPLSVRDYTFITDVIDGLSLKELSEKYHVSVSRVTKWKREACEKVHKFDVANLKR